MASRCEKHYWMGGAAQKRIALQILYSSARFYWAALSLSFRRISIRRNKYVNEHNKLYLNGHYVNGDIKINARTSSPTA